ncbi:YHS domain-containing (seleno)protein [Thalassobaculum sp.]|uniref:YHS domain-containing (seleno)protein n=1 Tax=Thalassobaculum sp. TaxID=2022740 RepID=UPI003B5B9516
MRYLPAFFRLSVITGAAAIGAVFVACGAGVPASGAATHGSAPVFARDGVALGGYDPVSYFFESEPAPGSATHQVTWQGTVWYFTSAENALRFRENPELYAPQYGGYSLYGMSRGKAYAADPKVFDIIDGKLYLSRNDAVREIWQRNPSGYIATADRKWRQAVWSEAPNQLVR